MDRRSGWLRRTGWLALFACLSMADAHAGAETTAEPPGTASVERTVRDCAVCPQLVLLPGGTLMMGSPATEPGRIEAEGPVHEVTVPPFLIGRFEVSQGEWKAVMGLNRSRFQDCGDSCPVEQVSWKDAQLFLHRLSATQGKRYRLPTEAEWEYAARAGSTMPWPSGESPDGLARHAWFSGVSSRSTHPVGQREANAFGLHDLHGNVWEWVEDVWHDSYNGAPTNASAWTSGGDTDRRVVRGGSWNYGVNSQRTANRYWGGISSRDYDLGFRVVRDLSQP